eukprot:PITA_28358
MVEEYDSIVRNNVWDVVPRLEDKSVVSSLWLYKVKQATYGSVEKHKAKFVAFDFSQVEGIEYDDTFSPVARINSYFTRLGFMKSEVDANLNHIVVKDKLLIIVLYVNDLILIGEDQLIKSCKEDLAREYEMKDMGLMHYFLGMEVWQGDGELFVLGELCQRDTKEILHGEKQTHVDSSSKPTKLYWKATKHVLRYLKGTTQYGLWYKQIEGVKLQGIIDADWEVSPSDRKRTSGGIFSIGSMEVSWYSRK